MRVTLLEQLASVLTEVRQEGTALHEARITRFSLITVRPAMSFSACARLASRTSATASFKFSRASSMVVLCVLAPGSSSTNPIHLSPSCSNTAVKWFSMHALVTFQHCTHDQCARQGPAGATSPMGGFVPLLSWQPCVEALILA